MRISCGPDRARPPRIVFAVFLIVAGVFLFLANLGLFPVRRVWDCWPLVFVAVGLGRLSNPRRPQSRVTGALFIILAIVFTLANTGVFHVRTHDDSWPISILLLVVGVGSLAGVLEGGRARRWPNKDAAGDQTAQPAAWPTKQNWASEWKSDAGGSSSLDEFVILGSTNRRLEGTEFQGGHLMCVLGNINLDLRRARFPQGKSQVFLEANSVLGAIKLRVPESWRVVWNGANVMGSFEDKTIPPNTGTEAPQLVMVGSAVLGAVEVES